MKMKLLVQAVINPYVIVIITATQILSLSPGIDAQGVDSHIADLAGIWDGTPR